MVPIELKLNIFKSGKFRVTPEQIDQLLKSKAIVFHSLTFLWHILLNYQTFAGAFYILFNRIDLVNKTCGFGIQYVTIWNQVIEQTYFNACLLQDILELFPNPKYEKIKFHLKTALPYVFSSVVFPLCILVTVNFWGIYSFYPHIIDEDNVTESYFPPWVNHGLHTTILLLACIEKFLVFRPYPARFWGVLGLFAVLLGYSGTCTILYYIGGVWPYPLITMLTFWQKILFIFANCMIGCLIIEIGDFLNKKIWGDSLKQTVEEVDKKLT